MADSIVVLTDVDTASTTITLNQAGALQATIRRVQDDGVISAVRNAEPANLVAGQWIGNDYEVPLDVGFYYTATSPQVPGASVISAGQLIPSNGLTWLKHPGQPALNQVVNVNVGPDLTYPITQGVFDVLGRPFPVAVSMRRFSARGTITLVTFDDDDTALLRNILDDGSPLLLSTPAGYGLGNRYIAVGDSAQNRVSTVGNEPTRLWPLPFITVDRPSGAALAVGNTWADVNGAYASWDAMLATEGTWGGLVSGIG